MWQILHKHVLQRDKLHWNFASIAEDTPDIHIFLKKEVGQWALDLLEICKYQGHL